MNWSEVYEWLKSHGHVSEDWDYIEISDGSFYAKDEMENTFISLFVSSDENELVAYVGCLNPKISVGGRTGTYDVVISYDVIDYLENHLENMYDELMRKAVEK